MKFTPRPSPTSTITPAVTIHDSYTKAGIRVVDATEACGKPPLILSTYGEPGSGKSRLCGTAPSPIGVLSLEYKSLPSIVAAAAEFGKKVVLPAGPDGKPLNLIRNSRASIIAQLPAQCVSPDDLTEYVKYEDRVKEAGRRMQAMSKAMRYTDGAPECCQQHAYRYAFNLEKAAGLILAADPTVRTIVIDTFGQFVEDGLFACYGRTEAIMPLDKKMFNQEIRDFLNCISCKHVILTHHSSVIWADNKPTKRTKPMTTFTKIGHYTTLAVKQTCDRKRAAEADGDEGGNGASGVYKLTIEDCLPNPSRIGDELEDDQISFTTLASLVYPEVDLDEWE